MLQVLSRTQLNAAGSAISAPSTEDLLRVWHAGRSIQDGTAKNYLRWISRFRIYCAQRKLDERAQLTQDGVYRFTAWYSQRHRDLRYLGGANPALNALRRVYQVMGLSVPAWESRDRVRRPATALLRAFADHLARRRSNSGESVAKRLDHIAKFSDYLSAHGKSWRTMKLTTIDAFLIETSQRYARSTVTDIAGSVRAFSRFLFATGRISVGLAESIVAPVQRKHEQPRRALPWKDVQRLLRSVDTSTPRGLRDYAILLMMSIYGFGAAEVIRLQLEDIDWNTGTLKVVRPKTGVAFTLPLLPAVAKALARYLRHGRPPSTPTRHAFVQMMVPFVPFSRSAVRHIIVRHAKRAGLKAPYLGSHVLRHSNAARQIDLGAQPRVISDILGHRDPESLSAYIRIATRSLRDVSLPVPTCP